MLVAAVIEKEGEHIAEALEKRLPGKLSIVRCRDMADVSAYAPEVIVVSPNAKNEVVGTKLPGKCRAVLVPENAGVRGAASVSYGMSGQDTVSLTSNLGERCILSVGSMTALDGAEIEPQERSILRRGLTDDELMAAGAVGMLMGLPPESL